MWRCVASHIVDQEELTLGFHHPPPGKSSRFSDIAAQESLDLICQLFITGGGTAVPESDIVAQRWKKVLWRVTFFLIVLLKEKT
jgi:hypothetical protein